MSATMFNSMLAIFFVSLHVGHLLGHLVHLHVGHCVHLHVGRHVYHRHVVSTLCEVSETLTEWKSETIEWTDRLTGGVGARDTCVSKNMLFDAICDMLP